MAIVHITTKRQILWGRREADDGTLLDPGFYLNPGENLPVDEETAAAIAEAHPGFGVQISRAAAAVAGPQEVS